MRSESVFVFSFSFFGWLFSLLLLQFVVGFDVLCLWVFDIHIPLVYPPCNLFFLYPLVGWWLVSFAFFSCIFLWVDFKSYIAWAVW